MGKHGGREAGTLTQVESMPNPAEDTGPEAPGTPPLFSVNGGMR